MLVAIRHKRSRPAWLALIAVVVAGVTVAVTLATVVIGSVVEARRASEPSPVALAARPEGRTDVRVTVPAAAQESPDALAARAEAGARAAALATIVPGATPPRITSSTPAAIANTGAAVPEQAAPRMEKTTDSEAVDAAVAGDADAHPAVPKHRYLPSRASAHAGARRAGNAGNDVARGEGSLRADIARYNAERGRGTERRHALTLRAASVPSVRSLWEEVPRPLSELYRN
ncbi:hypothetical protein OVY01_18060 [Robbsia sp. Bb-Pol-6]|uniref:Uncharacterized protein n=1 Tax=Robbsia betulipollinis TaxID=2981849 RepID=A0ABT3ZR73_9BURK|nr:hypothetical protein [Robbsia betulipollinis]MCY0389061.1 hypothetical protein [Robbsia betulipollinis]